MLVWHTLAWLTGLKRIPIYSSASVESLRVTLSKSSIKLTMIRRKNKWIKKCKFPELLQSSKSRAHKIREFRKQMLEQRQEDRLMHQANTLLFVKILWNTQGPINQQSIHCVGRFVALDPAAWAPFNVLVCRAAYCFYWTLRRIIIGVFAVTFDAAECLSHFAFLLVCVYYWTATFSFCENWFLFLWVKIHWLSLSAHILDCSTIFWFLVAVIVAAVLQIQEKQPCI